jgi:hypothetical protein
MTKSVIKYSIMQTRAQRLRRIPSNASTQGTRLPLRRLNQSKQRELDFFSDGINAIVVKTLKKQHKLAHHEHQTRITKEAADRLRAMYNLDNKYKECINFIQNHNIISKVYKNPKNYSEVLKVQCKIRNSRDICYFSEKMTVRILPKQHVLCLKFETKDFVE